MPAESIILVVDDEPLGRSALHGLLAREGYRLEFAADGLTALRMARELLPDLVLLDVMMPGMDGYAVTRAIRATPGLAEVPILLVTALDGPDSRLAGIEAGADDFLSKPFDRVELRARVRSIIRLNRFRRLLEEREKYRLLFDRCPCGLLVIDEGLQILEANSLATRLLDDVLGPTSPRNLLPLIPPPEAPHLRRILAEAKADPMATPRAEFMTRSLAGQPVWFELVVNSFPPGECDGYQVAVQDQTAKRLIEEEYRQAQKIESVGQLAGGIAHDFNNLLCVINGFSELILSTTPPEAAVREPIHQIHQAGERAAALTRQLLAFSRKQILSPVELDLNVLVPEILTMLRRLIGEDLTVRTHLAPAIVRIKADPSQIEQILMNLAVNARDAMSPGGVLTIETEDVAGGRGVRLAVSDTGSGMTAEVRARIFEPFFTTKEAGKGTGLGLATVYGIVQQSGGTIEVFSEPGRGTKFVIDFPRIEGEGETIQRPSGTIAFAKGTETVLLSEDEDAVRTISRIALETAGYKVLPASDGEDALRVSREYDGPIDLLITDVVMPRLGGRHLAESLRGGRPGVKVLFVSGYSDDAILRGGALEAGIAFLQKPYTPTTLLRKVREVLDG